MAGWVGESIKSANRRTSSKHLSSTISYHKSRVIESIQGYGEGRKQVRIRECIWEEGEESHAGKWIRLMKSTSSLPTPASLQLPSFAASQLEEWQTGDLYTDLCHSLISPVSFAKLISVRPILIALFVTSNISNKKRQRISANVQRYPDPEHQSYPYLSSLLAVSVLILTPTLAIIFALAFALRVPIVLLNRI